MSLKLARSSTYLAFNSPVFIGFKKKKSHNGTLQRIISNETWRHTNLGFVSFLDEVGRLGTNLRATDMSEVGLTFKLRK